MQACEAAGDLDGAAAKLDEIERLLSERYEFSDVVRRFKPDVSRPCPTETLEDLSGQGDVVVTAIGD